jgi:hypothetical protein
MMDRRYFLLAAATMLVGGPLTAAPALIVHKDPNCGCCGAWVDHLRKAGLAAEVRLETDMSAVKVRLGVPQDLASCHTAVLERLVIEGHVPAEAILKALIERPAIAGLAVPGMPIGSPGMEVAGATPEPFRVIAYTNSGAQSVFMDYPSGYRA